MSNEDIDQGKYSTGHSWWHKYLYETKENSAHVKRSVDTDAVGAHRLSGIVDLINNNRRLLALMSVCLIGCIFCYFQCRENRQITRELADLESHGMGNRVPRTSRQRFGRSLV